MRHTELKSLTDLTGKKINQNHVQLVIGMIISHSCALWKQYMFCLNGLENRQNKFIV